MAILLHTHKRILSCLGPTSLFSRVLRTFEQPAIHHFNITYIKITEEIQQLLRWIFQTKNAFIIPLAGPSSASIETCFANLIEPGDKVIVCENGFFSQCMIEMVQRCGGLVIELNTNWGQAIAPELLEHTLKNHKNVKAVVLVHAETSTGVLSDAKQLASIANSYGCLTIVDMVASLGGVPVYVDKWKIDAAYSCSDKCLAAVPGLALITFSKRAVAAINKRKTKIQNGFLDFNKLMQDWDNPNQPPVYPHSVPIHDLYKLLEALHKLYEEGLTNVWERYRNNSQILSTGLAQIGLMQTVPIPYRMPQITVVEVPRFVPDQEIRKHLYQKYNVAIEGGLGKLAGKVWRISLLGNNCRKENVELILTALKKTLI